MTNFYNPNDNAVEKIFVSLAEKIITLHTKSENEKNISFGENFNIFRILRLDRSEISICRLLVELLSPTGSHGQGIEFLLRFCRHVLHFEPKASELKTVRVYREFILNNSRRIDIVIETPHYFLPIELKIYAKDQLGQIAAYWQEAIKRQKSPKPKVYYLTLYGNEPTKESCHGVPSENIVCLSFVKDILRWLEKISDDKKLTIEPNVLEILRQFIVAIKEWTHLMKNEERKELISLLTNSAENICVANKVANVLNEAKAHLLPLLFTDIATKIDENFHHIYGHNLDFIRMDVSEEAIRRFYESPKNAYAHVGVYYNCRAVELSENYELHFAVEVETNLYCQYLVYDLQVEKYLDNIPTDLLPKVQEYFNESLEHTGDLHPDWTHLPLLPDRPCVNLRDRELMDEEILSLFDEKERMAAVERIIPVIETMLKKMQLE